MKKLVSIAMMTVLAAALAGCGAKAGAESSAAASSAAATEAAASTAAGAAAAESTAADESAAAQNTAFAGKTLIMATNAEFPPYEFHENNAIVGIDVDIVNAICEELGAKLEITDIAFDSIIPEVQSGKADLAAAGMTVTEDRKEQVDFSDSYATGVQSVIVKSDSDIKDLDGLKGKLIGVQLGTTGDIYASDEFGDSSVQRFPKGADAVQALSSGKIDAVIIDNKPAQVFVDEHKDELKLLETPYAEEQYAIAVKKGNQELLDGINGAIKKLQESGKLDEIVAKYINAK